MCTKQGNQIWMSSLHLLKYLRKHKDSLFWSSPFIQTMESGRCLLIGLILKIQTGNLGWGRCWPYSLFPKGVGWRTLSLCTFSWVSPSCLVPLRPCVWFYFLGLCSVFTIGMCLPRSQWEKSQILANKCSFLRRVGNLAWNEMCSGICDCFAFREHCTLAGELHDGPHLTHTHLPTHTPTMSLTPTFVYTRILSVINTCTTTSLPQIPTSYSHSPSLTCFSQLSGQTSSLPVSLVQRCLDPMFPLYFGSKMKMQVKISKMF